MSTAIDFKRRIYALRDLPTLPVVARKILLAAEDERSSHRTLARIVSRDQSLTAKVLGLANSAYYGHRAEVRTLNHAVSIIGSTMLKQLSLCAFVVDRWNSGGDKRANFWKHSIAVAYAASFLAERSGTASPDEAFCAGLLHDIGVLVLDTGFPKEYERVQEGLSKEGGARDAVERTILGIDHLQAGVWLGERWQLPASFVAAVADHHSNPVEGLGTETLADIVQVSDRVAAFTQMGLDGEYIESDIGDSGIWNAVAEHLQAKAEDIDNFFKMV